MADTTAPTEAAPQVPEVAVDPLAALAESIAARGKGAILSHHVRNGELTSWTTTALPSTSTGAT